MKKEIKRGMVILEHGLADLVLSLHKEGFSKRQIAEYLQRQKGLKVSIATVSNFLKLYNEIKDFRVAEKVKAVLKEMEEIDIKAFDSLVVGLKLVAKLQKDIMESPDLTLAQKALILDRLNRTRMDYSKNILMIYKELGFKELIEGIFDRLGTELAMYFRSIEVDRNIVDGVVEIMRKVYDEYRRRFEVKG